MEEETFFICREKEDAKMMIKSRKLGEKKVEQNCVWLVFILKISIIVQTVSF